MTNGYIEKFKTAIEGKTSIFIDAANLEQSVRDMFVSPKDIPDKLKKYRSDELSWRIDYAKLKEFFNKNTKLQKIYFYSANFGSDSHNKFLGFLKKGLGFKLITKPLKEYKNHTPELPHRKANFDVEIAVDTVFKIDNFENYILFSGDCDFEYLLKFLRGQNKITVIFSRSGHVAKELPPASNFYFDIVDFRFEFLKIERNSLLDAKNPA